ncbi:hypothetical protein [Streptomyces mirabilis]|uniref:hypothetical protein n=1 Tax=Streptomyces mirabilis TaxID=68239 RepID=UPI003689868C
MRPADRDGEEQPARPCARGRIGGQPTVVNADILRATPDLLPNPEHSITSITKLLGVSPGTLYNRIPDLWVGRSTLEVDLR